MTTPQSGREAFEAWAFNHCPGVLSRDVDDTGYTDQETHTAWRAWQAALAQQEMEVGEPVAWMCTAEARVPPAFVRSEEVARDTYERVGYNITPLYTAAPKQQAVDGWRVMLPTAPHLCREGDRWEIYDRNGNGGIVSIHDVRDWAVRNLLDELAALPGKTEVDRG